MDDKSYEYHIMYNPGVRDDFEDCGVIVMEADWDKEGKAQKIRVPVMFVGEDAYKFMLIMTIQPLAMKAVEKLNLKTLNECGLEGLDSE